MSQINKPTALPQQEILRIASSHGALKVRVFGSRARGEERSESDLDLLVEFEQGRTLLDAIGLEQELADLLGYPVQVLTPGGLSPHLREKILRTAIPLGNIQKGDPLGMPPC
ncbi:MAG: nucleotidyltransferase family protein [Candidatus Sumerlaeia bacterium]|nr:nucleotidyltransferase family protein [Candidatus Sumerlaeia bacterium]